MVTMNNATTPTPIVDKNGKATTVHKKGETATASTRVQNAPAPKTFAEQKLGLEELGAAVAEHLGMKETNPLDLEAGSLALIVTNDGIVVGDVLIDEEEWGGTGSHQDVTYVGGEAVARKMFSTIYSDDDNFDELGFKQEDEMERSHVIASYSRPSA